MVGGLVGWLGGLYDLTPWGQNNHFSQTLEEYRDRHRVATGLTGWAQVNKLRGDTSIEDRVRADNYYIENWSLWTDAKILVRTLGTFRHDPARKRPEVVSMLTAAARPAGSATAD